MVLGCRLVTLQSLCIRQPSLSFPSLSCLPLLPFKSKYIGCFPHDDWAITPPHSLHSHTQVDSELPVRLDPMHALPPHYSHMQVDSELPVRPGDQLQLMLVEAKQGGDAGPPRFTVTGHFALNDDEEEGA